MNKEKLNLKNYVVNFRILGQGRNTIIRIAFETFDDFGLANI